MPFIPSNWSAISSSGNTQPKMLQDGTTQGAPGIYTYQSLLETIATISSVDYFIPVGPTLAVNDLIYISGSDTQDWYKVLQVDIELGTVIIGIEVPTGEGDVVGPSSSVNNTAVRFDGTTGKLIKDSVVSIGNAGAVSGVTSLSVVGGDITLDDGDLVLLDGNATINGSLTASGLTYPTVDAPPGYVVTTNGFGQLNLQSNPSGDVVGPSAATNNNLVRYDGTTGKLVKDSSTNLDNAGNLSIFGDLSCTGLPTLAGFKYPTSGFSNLGFVLTIINPGEIAAVAPAGNVSGPGSSTNNALVRFSGTSGKTIKNSNAILTDGGQLTLTLGLISSGLTFPTLDGSPGDVVTTDGAGNLTLQSPDVTPFEVVTTTPFTMSAGGRYVQNSGSLITFVMPEDAAVGDTFHVVGFGDGGWKIQFFASQFGILGIQQTTAAGAFLSTNQYDVMKIVCVQANTYFQQYMAPVGNIGII